MESSCLYNLGTHSLGSDSPSLNAAPKISIVLPVYNVEKYLRQCLDSVVNQTMSDIQIICVNDGSTDGSRAILQEYADRDSRIEIIDQENQGAGSARNAAYPFIKGKYTYFADPDDWLEHDLCEKAVRCLDETDADAVVFHANMLCGDRISEWRVFDPYLPKIRYASPQEKNNLLHWAVAPWTKVWTSDFLSAHRIFFCEGKRPANDVVHHWHGVVLAKKIATLDEVLYVYRVRPGSYQEVQGRSHFIIIKTMNDLEFLLRDIGLFASYESDFRRSKVEHFRNQYLRTPSGLRQEFRELILENLTAEDREFYRTAPEKLVSKNTKLFYEMIDGGLKEYIKYHVLSTIDPIIKLPEQALRRWVIKPIKKRLKAA